MLFLFWLAGLPRTLALLCIRAYQATAPMRPRLCRYHPSCSEYTAQSILKHGLFAGIALNGATLRPDLDANAELYGKKVANADIVAGKFAVPTAAVPLIEKLTKYSARK